MKKASFGALVSLSLVTACDAPEPGGTAGGDAAPIRRTAAREEFFVVLTGAPAVRSIPAGVDARSAAAAAQTKKRLLEIHAEQSALEPRLVLEGAEVVGRLSRLVNVIQVAADEETAGRIARLPGVLRVERAPVVQRSLLSAVPTVGAPEVWTSIPGLKGEGISIGIIDSGIDYTHADFGGEGTQDAYLANDPTIVEAGSFPTAKVVWGRDFVGDAYNPEAGIGASPDDDPLDCTTVVGEQISGGHGTHVAGIAAGTGVTSAGEPFTGPYEASLDRAAFRVGPGVAPLANLYAFKVFGCQGSTTMLAAALDRAADPNGDGSFDDRLDVINASLGSSFALGSSITGELITELTSVGTLVVAAAGNDGQTFFSTGSPASFPEVLSVAASVDSDLLNLRVTAPEAQVAVYPAAEGLFTASLASTGPLAAPLVAADPPLGCEPFFNAGDVAGSIVLLDRGTCPFVDKFANAVLAGAIGGVLVDNEVTALPFTMPGDPGTSPIPGFTVTQADGAILHAALAAGPVTITLDATDRFTGPGAELLGNFSSRGPSAADGRLKPEISAPGAAIASAGVGTGSEPRLNQGTSMASPVVAGAAALLRQSNPGLSPMAVKASLMNTAVPLANLQSIEYTSTVMGAGRVNVARAVASTLTAAFDEAGGEIGISFGAVVSAEPTTQTRTFQVHNHGAAAETLALTVDPTFELPGVVVTVNPAELQVAAGQTASAELTLSFDPVALGDAGADPGTSPTQGNSNPQARHYLNQATGHVRLQGAGGDIGLPYTGSVRAASAEHGVPPSACGEALPEGAPVSIAREGAGAHPSPVVTAFQLVGLDDADERSATDSNEAMVDLRAVGVATNLATVTDFSDAFVHFGVAVEGPWSTPARGPLSVVKVRVDANGLGGDDFEIRVEARNPDGPFRDALVASVYDLDTGERAEMRYPVNVVLADVAHTYPFNSTVLVLSANLEDLDIDPDAPVFDFSVRTERPDTLTEGSDRVDGTFDPATLVLDAAPHGLEDLTIGWLPIFLPGEPILVDVAAGARESGAPLDLLLLQHTNAPGDQWQVVSLVKPSMGNVTVMGTGPASVAADQTAEVVFTVQSDQLAPGVAVTGVASGGEIVSASTDTGSCAGTGLSCEIGELAPGATAVVRAVVRSTGSGPITVDASVTSTLGCESDTADNTAQVSLAVDGGPANPPFDRTAPSGGCACEAVGSTSHRAGAGGWLAFLAVAAAYGRRRVTGKRPSAINRRA